MTELMRKITIPTQDTPDLSDLRYLVEHSAVLGIPERADVRLLRRVTSDESRGPFGPQEPAMVITWREPAP